MEQNVKEKLIELATRRLKYLVDNKGLMPCVYRDFVKDGTVYYSERMKFSNNSKPIGALYFLNELGGAPDEWIKEKERLESEGYIVYHVTHEYTDFGEMVDFFIVSEDDFEYNEEYIFNDMGISFAYVHGIFSEYGDIGFEVSGGGIIRHD